MVRTVISPSRQSVTPRHQVMLVRSCQSRTNSPTYTPLLEVVRQRRAQARRSILVQVAGPDSGRDLGKYCQTEFGEVEMMSYYVNTNNKKFSNFFILEFSQEESVNQVLNLAQHSEGDGALAAVPVYSPFLWLQSPVASPPSDKPSTARTREIPIDFSMKDRPALEVMVRHMSDPSEQMFHLWKYNEMTDTSLKIRWVRFSLSLTSNHCLLFSISRFLVCRQVELAISGMFPFSQVLPFGSAINGFGTCSSDQDMVLLFDDHNQTKRNRLVFQAKSAMYGGDRAQVGSD